MNHDPSSPDSDVVIIGHHPSIQTAAIMDYAIQGETPDLMISIITWLPKIKRVVRAFEIRNPKQRKDVSI